jgi:hypothetical protein
MICKLQVVTLGQDGHQETREIACLQRTDLKPETLGLTLAEAKAILKGLQAMGSVADSTSLTRRPPYAIHRTARCRTLREPQTGP